MNYPLNKNENLEFVNIDLEGLTPVVSRLKELIKPGQVILFNGDLGAGKTTFIRLLCESIGLSTGEAVKSPSFSLVNTYETDLCQVHHFDLYRLDNMDQLLQDIGFDEYLNSHSVLMIEWGEKLGKLPLSGYYKVDISYNNENSRDICISYCN